MGDVDPNILQPVYSSTNMETFDLNGVLRREYPLGNVSWGTSAGLGTLLQFYNLPEVIFSQPFINEKLRDFRLFRGGIRLTFRLAANKFLYGKLLIYTNPMPNVAPNNGELNAYIASGYPHVILSASANDACVFDIPFISDKRALDLANYFTNEIAEVRIKVLVPLIDVQSNSVTSTQIFVTGQLLDPEVFLPHNGDTVAGKPPIPPSLLSKTDTSDLKGDQEVDDEFTVQSETVKKSEKNVLAKEFEDVVTKTSNIVTSVANSSYTKLAIKAAPYVATMLGLSKPTTVAMTNVNKINPFSDINYGKGIDLAVKLAMDPENGISTQPNVGGISEDEMTLAHIAGTPMIVQQVSFVEGTPASQLVSLTRNGNQTAGYVDRLSDMFFFKSGSYKIKMYITASLFHSVRFVIWMADTPSSPWQNCYHKIIDIQGDSEVEFMTPYFESKVVSNDVYTNPFAIYGQPLTWSVPDPALSVPITFTVYRAAASDFKFGGLRDLDFIPQSDPRADFREAFPFLHEEMKGYGQNNLLYGEEYTTYREILHRYIPGYAVAANSSYPIVRAYNTIGAGAWGLSGFLNQFFAFQRGSIRIKLLTRIYNLMEQLSIQYEGEPLCGVALSSTVNPLLDFEVPYYSDKLFVASNLDNALTFRFTGTTNMFMMQSVGDDFSLHYLRPSNYVPVTNTFTNGGMLAMQAFFN